MSENSHSIEQTIDIHAPAERVFHALTAADDLVRWFPTTAQSDPRPGGAYAFAYEFVAATDRNHAVAGTFLDLVHERSVRYSWPAGHAQVPTEVSFALAPEAGATKLTLTHSGRTPGTEESRREHEMGWGFFLQNLKSWLERGEDARASAMGMKTVVAV